MESPDPGTQRAFNLGILHLAIAFLCTMRMASFLWVFDDSRPVSSSLYIICLNRRFQNLEPSSTCLLDLSNGPIQQMNNQGGKRLRNTCFYQGRKMTVMRAEQWMCQLISLIGKPGWPVSPRGLSTLPPQHDHYGCSRDPDLGPHACMSSLLSLLLGPVCSS